MTDTGEQAQQSISSSALGSAAKEELQQAAVALRQRGQQLKEINGGYTKAEVAVTVDSAEESAGTATVKVTEDTKLYFPDVQPGEPEFEEFELPHVLTFNRTENGWLLHADQAEVDVNGPAATTQLNTPAPIIHPEPPYYPRPTDPPTEPETVEGQREEGAASTERPAVVESGNKITAAGLSYSKMAQYADRYWKRPNSDYRVYGNDCTNFISQAMRAGGWGTTSGSAASRKNNKKWFYGSFTWTTSYTWAGAENWYWFASRHSKRTKLQNNVWKLAYADVLQADWNRDNTIDHTMIVTATGHNERYLTYHTSNTHNRKLSSLLAARPNAWWYVHRT
ncbi:amidase domain-containing protein [Streptomyces sp. NPDC005407]|uniref:amidase domain-containing protein n=1 Tax=Streptomyces sp. NPDC005407 TaxID=3155340 RepID=UPI0033B6A292